MHLFVLFSRQPCWFLLVFASSESFYWLQYIAKIPTVWVSALRTYGFSHLGGLEWKGFVGILIRNVGI